MPRAKRKEGLRDQLVSMKRDGIIEAATRLILERGYHGCSMDALAEALGVTKPFIYYQFRDKAEILGAICRTGADLTLEAVVACEAIDTDTEARLRWFCLRLATIVVTHGHFLAVYMRELTNLSEDYRHAIVRTRDEIDRRLARLIAAGAKEGRFEVVDPLISARAITGMLSYIYMWHRDADVMPDEALCRTMADIAMRTLFPTQAATQKKRTRSHAKA
jgi:AcrR family transcriptional regulator